MKLGNREEVGKLRTTDPEYQKNHQSVVNFKIIRLPEVPLEAEKQKGEKELQPNITDL